MNTVVSKFLACIQCVCIWFEDQVEFLSEAKLTCPGDWRICLSCLQDFSGHCWLIDPLIFEGPDMFAKLSFIFVTSKVGRG